MLEVVIAKLANLRAVIFRRFLVAVIESAAVWKGEKRRLPYAIINFLNPCMRLMKNPLAREAAQICRPM